MIIYIIFRNKADNYDPYLMQFETINEALIWGKKEIDNFHPDMIKINLSNSLNPLKNESLQ
jgi:hypothetical protein